MVPTRRLFTIFALVTLVVFTGIAGGLVAPQQKPATKTLIVKMAKGLTLAQSQAIVSRSGGTPKGSIPKLDLQIVEYRCTRPTRSRKASRVTQQF